MSYIVARMQKMKAGNLGGSYKHNERVFDKHSNKDINPERTHLNYELTDRDRSISYEKQIKKYINENKISKRAIRKDAVLADEWVITSDKQFFENLSAERTREFFETAMRYFAENYGKSNIAYANVHMDESTPHMHMGIVPMRDGKLSSKAMFTREELRHIQEDLPRYMNEHGFELERGKENSQAKHMNLKEFKEHMASQELEKSLVQEFNAPEYINTSKNRYIDKAEYEETLEVSRFLGEEVARPTTIEEKIEWVKEHQQTEIQELKQARTQIKADIDTLNEYLVDKLDEVAKIDSKASQSLSELSKAREYIDSLENQSYVLETKIEDLRIKSVALEQKTTRLSEMEVMSEFELQNIQPKKNLFGKEYIELSTKQFEELKGLLMRNKRELRDKEIELSNAERLVPFGKQRMTFKERMERAKQQGKEDRLKDVMSENKALKSENSILRQQNEKMFDKLREFMPDKALKKFVDELKAIKPIVEIVKHVIERGLGL